MKGNKFNLVDKDVKKKTVRNVREGGKAPRGFFWG